MRTAVQNNPPWQHIVSSPLTRCRDFSMELAAQLQVPCSIDDRVKEIGFGSWEGKTPEQILADDKEALNHFYTDPVNNRPEGAEPLDSFARRVWEAYQDILQQHQNKQVLIVAHAGVARAIIARTLQMSLDDVYSRLRIEYGGIISTSIDENAPPRLLIRGPK